LQKKPEVQSLSVPSFARSWHYTQERNNLKTFGVILRLGLYSLYTEEETIVKQEQQNFSYHDLNLYLHSQVYEPAEDTFLLLDVLDVNFNEKVLEIGTGCGIISLECARRGAQVISTDLNPHAVNLAQYNYQNNQSNVTGTIEFRQGDLFDVIHEHEAFDCILFNPPYLPTTDKERIGGDGWFDLAVDGGVDGLDVIKRFIATFSRFLLPNGRAYLIFSTLAPKNKFKDFIYQAKLTAVCVARCHFDNESLEVYRLTNNNLQSETSR
jgi:release factor glutamine methyltransferase